MAHRGNTKMMAMVDIYICDMFRDLFRAFPQREMIDISTHPLSLYHLVPSFSLYNNAHNTSTFVNTITQFVTGMSLVVYYSGQMRQKPHRTPWSLSDFCMCNVKQTICAAGTITFFVK